MKRTVVLATASVYAAMYVSLVFGFSPISYGVFNLRVANILVGLIPMLGWPGIIGQTLGVFIANQPAFGDQLGAIDLINAIPTFICSWILWRLRKKSVFLGLTIYSATLGLSVSFALGYAFNLPLLVTIPQVTVGIFAATTVLGYFLYKAVNKLGVLQRRFPS